MRGTVSSTASAIQVVEFVRALSLTWKNVSAYPSGHPALTRSLDIVGRCLREIRGPAGDLVLGITADGLLYGNHKIEIPAARKFAETLYTRGVAVLRFSIDADTMDIESFLRVMSAGARDPKRAFSEELTAAGVVNINVQAVHYSSVHLTDNLDDARRPDDAHKSVWEDIVRALLENRGFAAGRDVPHVETADAFSRLVEECIDADDAFAIDADGTFGIRLTATQREDRIHRFLERTVGNRISEAAGMKKQHSLEQAVQLMRTLPKRLRQTILRGVMRALATDEKAAALLRDFTAELPRDEVLDSLRYLQGAEQLSSHATRLLDAVSALEASARAEPPSPSIVADLVRLFGDEDIARINPDEHDVLLSTIAVRVPELPPEAMTSIERLGLRAESVAETMPQFTWTLFDLLLEIEPSRSADPLLERLQSIFLTHVRAEQFDEAIALMHGLQTIATQSDPSVRGSIDHMIVNIAEGDVMHALIENVHLAKPETAAKIQRLTEVLGTGAHRGLLVALADENNRSRRRRLFDFLVSLGPQIVPEVRPFLQDERWYVIRNMIVLLRTLHDRTSVGELRKLAWHPDLRVRIEAIKSLLAYDGDVPAELLHDMFNDADPKVAETAVTIVGNYGLKEAVGPLLHVLNGNDPFGAKRTLRVKALRALGEIGDERVLPQIDRFLKQPFMPWPSREERYAAWESLRKYPATARKSLLERGMRSLDPQVRAICKNLIEA